MHHMLKPPESIQQGRSNKELNGQKDFTHWHQPALSSTQCMHEWSNYIDVKEILHGFSSMDSHSPRLTSLPLANIQYLSNIGQCSAADLAPSFEEISYCAVASSLHWSPITLEGASSVLAGIVPYSGMSLT